MYKLLIDKSIWKDCAVSSTEEDVLYIARTLSKFSRCHVDIYKCHRSINFRLTSFHCGKIYRGEVA